MKKKKEKRKLMAWIEVYGGQRSLAFELTTAILWVEIHEKCALGAMATMEDYVSGHFMWNSHTTLLPVRVN